MFIISQCLWSRNSKWLTWVALRILSLGLTGYLSGWLDYRLRICLLDGAPMWLESLCALYIDLFILLLESSQQLTSHRVRD